MRITVTGLIITGSNLAVVSAYGRNRNATVARFITGRKVGI